MSLTTENTKNIPTCFASVSIGCRDEHTLPKKLEAISSAGFSAIELGFPDLLAFASTYTKKEVGEYDYDDLVISAKVVKAMCDAKKLKVLILQPFANFEGWQEGSKERKDAFHRAENWIRIMEAAGTDMLQVISSHIFTSIYAYLTMKQVGSSDTPAEKIGTDRSRFVSDLQELADMLAKKNFRLAYENWCWSTHAPTWKDVWQIVQQVNRPNVGLCLDTFQSAGYEWADPTTESGLVDKPKNQLEKDWKESLDELARTVPADKIFFLQISDAYKPKQPFSNDVDESGTRPRGRWSHDFRPLPFQGYLPVVDFTRAVLKTGFRGYFSYEVFDGGEDGKGKDYELQDFANEAMATQSKLIAACVDA
ncbi:putative 4-hydroxyphenylpyruvate dioxygenase [Aureobasidium sp. EXF-12298]|nr:putative 4-hydroxyphenylpyruvate dioxygenase [Aureobasidium sp. EXF-12298]KAI4750352.1 putative 4-hydroxyphenylpyruvate dioxygenase [Aureobasidium sp. EXF-12344]KAI4767791.1 putative 4-hydroxyphenylpyruvate dioxygenase [Aureobasidium sp. EXF-3400]